MTCTSQQLRERIAKLVETSPLYDAFVHESGLKRFVEHGMSLGISVTNEHIWGHTANLAIDRDLDVTLSWSSTQRSPAMASTVIALYLQITELATLIQALVDSTKVSD